MGIVPQNVSPKPSACGRPLRDERGIGFLLVLVIVAVVGAVAAGGVAAVLLLREEAHPPEETAKLLPSDTQIYFSLSLRPGNDQLRKFGDILGRFREHPNLQPKIDDLLEDAEAETGIDLREDIFPWIGPHVSIGVIDVVGSAIAGTTGGTPLVVALIGTTDSEQSVVFLQDWIAYQEQEGGLAFDAEPYRGFTVYSEQNYDQHYAVTEEYLLLTSERELLEDTIDRVADQDVTGSLYSSSRFQEALDALPEPRFSMLYVDAGVIWRDARRQLGDVLPAQVRQQLDDLIPEWAALTGSFIDRGVKLVVSAARSEGAQQTALITNSLASSRLLPSDTFAFVSFALGPDLDPLREQLADQRIPDLGSDVYDALSLGLGLPIDEDASFSDVLDVLLDRFRGATGLDLERDFLSWMTGEFSFAWLSTDLQAFSTDPDTEAQEAALLIQFDTEERDKVLGTMDEVIDLLEGSLPVQRIEVSYGGGQGVVLDIRELAATTAYRPGYLALDDHLIVATTVDALKLVASISQNQGDALVNEPEYSRLLKEVSGTRDAFIYVNIRGIIEAAVETLDGDSLREYRENAEPFIGPLRAILMTSDTREEVSSFSILLTVE